MQKNIVLQESEMGLSFRESKYNIMKLCEKAGYDYEIHKNFIEDYESKLLKQYRESKK